MPNIYLGATQATALANGLPPIRWTDGGDPGFPIDYTKQIDKATMLDGAPRYNFRWHHPRRWTLSWEMLTTDEFDYFLVLNAYEAELKFLNEWEESDWRDVVISAFEYTPVVKLGACFVGYVGDSGLHGGRWNVSITLDEVI